MNIKLPEVCLVALVGPSGSGKSSFAHKHFASSEVKVTERYTKIGPDHIEYTATLEDAATYTEPWTMRMILYRRIGPDAELFEFNCVEFVEELIYGHLRKEPLDR